MTTRTLPPLCPPSAKAPPPPEPVVVTDEDLAAVTPAQALDALDGAIANERAVAESPGYAGRVAARRDLLSLIAVRELVVRFAAASIGAHHGATAALKTARKPEAADGRQ